MNTLRLEADNAQNRAEEAEANFKKLQQELLHKEQEISSLNHQLGEAQTKLDIAEEKEKSAKIVHQDHETSKMNNETLVRKVQLLEEELDNAEKNLKETVEKCVIAAGHRPLTNSHMVWNRLRQMDLKAEHFERQVGRLEQERDGFEKKYEVRRGNRWLFTAHTTSICRRPKISAKNTGKSWTIWLRTWKGFDWSTVFGSSPVRYQALTTAGCI